MSSIWQSPTFSSCGPDDTPASNPAQRLSTNDVFESSVAFSGLELTGWVRDELNTIVRRPGGTGVVSVSVTIPESPGVAFPYQVSLDVDGAAQTFEAHTPGVLTMTMPVAANQRPTETHIRLHPGTVTQSVHLNSIAFGNTAGDNTIAMPPEVSLTSGIDADGWMNTTGTLTVKDRLAPGMLEVEVEVPGWAELDHLDLATRVDGSPTPAQAFEPGIHLLRIPLRQSRDRTQIVLDADRSFALPAPDTRMTSLRILSVRLVATGAD